MLPREVEMVIDCTSLPENKVWHALSSPKVVRIHLYMIISYSIPFPNIAYWPVLVDLFLGYLLTI